MKNLFYIMGKSSTGKDTIYQEKKNKIEINSYIRYTTRPKRANEKNGREYFFISNKQLEAFEKSNKIMESRSYNVINNNGKADIWTYATIADEQLEKRGDFLTIGTLASYNTLRKYIQEHPETDIKIIPIYINVSEDEIRKRAIKREEKQEKPNYEEMERRLNADNIDFSTSKLKQARISNKETFYNYNLNKCVNKIIKYIKEKEGEN